MITDKLLLKACIFFSLLGSTNEQTPTSASTFHNRLLTWEYQKEVAGTVATKRTYVLCAYEKADTGYVRTEVLKTPYMVLDYSAYTTQVVQNRYLINSVGDIIDLKSQKLIFEHIGSDLFDGIKGDSVFFVHVGNHLRVQLKDDSLRHSQINSSRYYYHLRTKRIEELKTGKRMEILPSAVHKMIKIHGIKSPNRDYEARFTPKEEEDPFWHTNESKYASCGWARIFPVKGTLSVTETKSGAEVFTQEAIFSFGLTLIEYLPIHWLNETTLITHASNGHLLLIDLKKNSVSKFEPIRGVRDCTYPAYFKTDGLGNLFYMCPSDSGYQYLVDTANRKTSLTNTRWLSEDFGIVSTNYDYRDIYDVKYTFRGQEITSDTTQTVYFTFQANRLAFQLKAKEAPKHSGCSQDKILIFNGDDQSLDTIKVECLVQLVGCY